MMPTATAIKEQRLVLITDNFIPTHSMFISVYASSLYEVAQLFNSATIDDILNNVLFSFKDVRLVEFLEDVFKRCIEDDEKLQVVLSRLDCHSYYEPCIAPMSVYHIVSPFPANSPMFDGEYVTVYAIHCTTELPITFDQTANTGSEVEAQKDAKLADDGVKNDENGGKLR